MRTDLIPPWRAGVGSGAQPGSQAASRQGGQAPGPAGGRPQQPAAPRVWTHEVGDGSQCSLSLDGRLLWARVPCPTHSALGRASSGCHANPQETLSLRVPRWLGGAPGRNAQVKA